ncbi:hypothetical protein MN608_07290 [Microdochium nivale]|nr:hypothetical protein MN608_07290 [Microdochium nivale]
MTPGTRGLFEIKATSPSVDKACLWKTAMERGKLLLLLPRIPAGMYAWRHYLSHALPAKHRMAVANVGRGARYHASNLVSSTHADPCLLGAAKAIIALFCLLVWYLATPKAGSASHRLSTHPQAGYLGHVD